MSVLAPPRSMHFLNSGMGFRPVAQYKKDNGVYVVEREPVFRSGMFRDSMGDLMTWEPLHMKQMVDNFSYLRSTGVFSDVPVRDGHPGWIVNNTPGTGAVVGWHTGVEVQTLKSPVDGEEYDYFLASYEITEPYAVEKRERGTWRNRSSEILRYYTNAEAEYWPVYGGFAFVDIPAVEGLNFAHDGSAAHHGEPAGRVRYFVMSDNRETQVTTPAPGAPAQPIPPASPANPAPIQPAQPIAPAPTASQSSQSANHSAPHVFTINGQATTDFAAVQQHITVLETAATEARNAGRAAFVTSLVSANLVIGTDENVKELTEFAQGLTDDQFVAWKKGYEAFQRPALMSVHASPAAGTAGVPGSAAPSTPANDAIEVAKGIVKYHRSNNMPLDTLKATSSYQQLVAAGIEKA